MTEEEWLTTTDPFGLIDAQRVVVTPRKMQLFGNEVEVRDTERTPLLSLTQRKTRLFGVACCRRAASRLPLVFVNLLLEVEQQAENMNSPADFSSLHDKA